MQPTSHHLAMPSSGPVIFTSGMSPNTGDVNRHAIYATTLHIFRLYVSVLPRCRFITSYELPSYHTHSKISLRSTQEAGAQIKCYWLTAIARHFTHNGKSSLMMSSLG